MGVCGNVCCVAAFIQDSVFEPWSVVHPVAVLNATFCMTRSLLILAEDARGNHMEEAYSRAGLMAAL